MENYYDIVIIGSGIAGLYSAYNIKKMCPTLSFVVLERVKKEWIGGRIGNDQFYGNTVVVGAGVGRKKKDVLLVKLLKELHVKTVDCDINMNYAKTIHQIMDIPKIIDYLQKIYQTDPQKYRSKTFAQFAEPILGTKTYNLFKINA